MSLLLKVVASVSLAAAAFWSSARVPVTPPPALPPAWAEVDASTRQLADTLSTSSSLGQLIAAPVDAPDLDALVAAGHIGRIELASTDVESHLARLDTWQAAAPIPIHLSTARGPDLGVPVVGAPALPTPETVAATGRPDLAFMAGKAVASTARTLGVQTPSSVLVLAAGTSRFGPTSGGALERSLVRGLRDGRVLPSARLADSSGLDALDALADAGLMELHLRTLSIETIRTIKDVSAFNGLVVVDVDDHADGAIDAVAAGADVVTSDAPAALYDSLAQGVRDGRITRARLAESTRRVLAAKSWAGLDLSSPRAPDADGGNGQVVRIRAWRPPTPSLISRTSLLTGEITRRAVTVVQEEEGPLPLVGLGVPPSVFTIVLDPSSDTDGGLPFVNMLATGLGAESQVSYTRMGLGLSEDRYDEAVEAANNSDLVILAALAADGEHLAPRHRALAAEVLRSGRSVVFVTLGPATLASGLDTPSSLVVAHGATDDALTAAAQAVVGQLDVAGRLPRGVAGVAAAGAGIRLRQQALRPGAATEVGLRAGTEQRIDEVVTAAVAQGAFPGGAVAVGRDGVLLRLKGYGRLSRGQASVTPDTPYDLASLTKVVGTTTAAMQLVEEGALDLDTEVVEYLPRYRGLGKEFVTVRQLLEHSAGQRPWYPFYAHDALSREAALDFIYADTLRYPPGTRSRYSDFDMIILGEVIQAVTGHNLDDVLQERIFDPLGMTATGFRGVGVIDRTVAPTETDAVWRGRTLQGEVHDEAASVFGGVAGHAGLFSTASDLSRFAFVLANGGRGYGVELFRRTTLDTFTRHVRLQSTYPTGLGWMVNAGRGNTAAGTLSARAFGHTGFTGTSIWVDPDTGLFVVLLTNRVHPTRRNRRIGDVRTALADAIVEAVVTPPRQGHLAWGFGPIPDDLPEIAQR